MSKADSIRQKIKEKIDKARALGQTTVRLQAGHFAHVNLPNVCQAMTGRKLEREANVTIMVIEDNQGREGPEARPSTRFWVTYQLDPIHESLPPITNSASSNEPSHSSRPRETDQPDELTKKQLEAGRLLRELKAWFDEGVINQEDYESKKKEILARL